MVQFSVLFRFDCPLCMLCL